MPNTMRRRRDQPIVDFDGDVDDLLDLLDEDFVELVKADAHHNTTEWLHRALRHDDVVDRTYAHALGMRERAESEITARRAGAEAAEADLEALDDGVDQVSYAQALNKARDLRADFNRWYPSHMRYKALLEEYFHPLKHRRDEAARGRVDPNLVDGLQYRVETLEGAIRLHRSSVDPDEATDADQTLWEHLR